MAVLVAALIALTPGIRTPTGNISCFVTHGRLRCEIREAVYRQTLQDRCTATASLDWHGWEMSARGRPLVTCSGGILYTPGRGAPRYRTLAYGSTWRSGAFTCVSRRVGLTCANLGGHRLLVSRQAWSRR